MIIEAITNLRPTSTFTLMGDTYDTLIWQDPNTTAPTEEEVNIEIARLDAQQPLNDCKSKATSILTATDWTQANDCPLVNKAEFTAYRATVRALAINPVANPIFPELPTEQW